MALIGVPVEEAVRSSPAKLFNMFCRYAGYFEDAPECLYAIRVGSRTFSSNDTLDLRKQFTRRIGTWKRRRTLQANKNREARCRKRKGNTT